MLHTDPIDKQKLPFNYGKSPMVDKSMEKEREEIKNIGCRACGDCTDSPADCVMIYNIAQAIVDAGYRKVVLDKKVKEALKVVDQFNDTIFTNTPEMVEALQTLIDFIERVG